MKDGLLYVTFTGTITEADLDKVAVDVLEIETASPVIPHRISDLSMVTDVGIDFSSIPFTGFQRRMETKIANPIRVRHSVASRPEHVGFARMFQTVNRHPQITIRIFPDAASALAWLTAN